MSDADLLGLRSVREPSAFSLLTFRQDQAQDDTPPDDILPIRQAKLTALGTFAYDSHAVQAESWASWRPSVHAPGHIRHGKASSLVGPPSPAR